MSATYRIIDEDSFTLSITPGTEKVITEEGIMQEFIEKFPSKR